MLVKFLTELFEERKAFVPKNSIEEMNRNNIMRELAIAINSAKITELEKEQRFFEECSIDQLHT